MEVTREELPFDGGWRGRPTDWTWRGVLDVSACHLFWVPTRAYVLKIIPDLGGDKLKQDIRICTTNRPRLSGTANVISCNPQIVPIITDPDRSNLLFVCGACTFLYDEKKGVRHSALELNEKYLAKFNFK